MHSHRNAAATCVADHRCVPVGRYLDRFRNRQHCKHESHWSGDVRLQTDTPNTSQIRRFRHTDRRRLPALPVRGSHLLQCQSRWPVVSDTVPCARKADVHAGQQFLRQVRDEEPRELLRSAADGTSRPGGL